MASIKEAPLSTAEEEAIRGLRPRGEEPRGDVLSKHGVRLCRAAALSHFQPPFWGENFLREHLVYATRRAIQRGRGVPHSQNGTERGITETSGSLSARALASRQHGTQKQLRPRGFGVLYLPYYFATGIGFCGDAGYAWVPA